VEIIKLLAEPWSRIYGIDRLLVGPQFRGGTIRCGLYVNIFLAGLDM
jgi:hypothetical protein